MELVRGGRGATRLVAECHHDRVDALPPTLTGTPVHGTSPTRFLAGEASIAGERLQFALSTMYDSDADFRAAVNESMPDLAELRLGGSGEVGERLESQLLDLIGAAQQQQKQGRAQGQQQQDASGTGAAPQKGST